MNQSDMIVLGDPNDGDRGRFRVLPSFGGTAVFDADFRSFTFAPHTHETLMLGLIWSGRKRFRASKTLHDVATGGLSVVNPGETHTGGVIGSDHALRYTAVYPSAQVLAEAGLPPGADVGSSVIEDRVLSTIFAQALSPFSDAACAEEALLIGLSGLTTRAARTSPQPARPAPTAVARAIDYIMADLAGELRLDSIASAAALSARHLIRSFNAALGMTPQEFIRQERVRQAATLLRNGEATSRVAQIVGFADQSHMTRAFRSVMGTTPSAYARSWRR